MIAQSRRAALGAGGVLPAALAAWITGCGPAPVAPPAARALLVSDRGGAVRLYEVDDDAGSITLVGSESASDTASVDSMPARLPDGRIVFVSNRGGAPALYLAASGGSGARPLFATPAVAGTADTDPAPCGADRILFARAPAAGAPRDLWIAGNDGSGARPLTSAPADDGAPCLLPDRRTVIFVSDRGGPLRLYQIDLAAPQPESTLRPVTAGDGSGERDPAGAPDRVDDTAPACLEDGSILFARSAAGRPRQVMALALDATPPALRQVTDPVVLPYGAGEPVSIGGGRFLLTAGPGKGPGGKPRYGIYRLTTGGYNLMRITREGAGYSDFARGLELLR